MAVPAPHGVVTDAGSHAVVDVAAPHHHVLVAGVAHVAVEQREAGRPGGGIDGHEQVHVEDLTGEGEDVERHALDGPGATGTEGTMTGSKEL